VELKRYSYMHYCYLSLLHRSCWNHYPICSRVNFICLILSAGFVKSSNRRWAYLHQSTIQLVRTKQQRWSNMYRQLQDGKCLQIKVYSWLVHILFLDMYYDILKLFPCLWHNTQLSLSTLLIMQALLQNSTDAMKESRTLEILNAVWNT